MDSLSELLGSLSPEDMQRLKQTAQSLFAGENEKADPSADTPPLDISGLDLNLLSGLLKPADDARAQLIRSLKPMLSEQRQQRAEEAVKLLHLVSLLPALKDSGILDQLMGGL